ncbi:MAG: Cna B-type domain-containing protein, partial [Oscillospiraceae bacterium]|nr:Cna B-type domain-containing protein [Oscillospiraceae bacterium]
QQTGGAAKANYSVNAGQRRVDFVLTPSLTLSGGKQGVAATTTTVTITDILPPKVNVTGTRYWMGGTYTVNLNHPYGGELTGGTEIYLDEPASVNATTGETTLKWVIPNVRAGEGTLLPIHYSAWIGAAGGQDTGTYATGAREVTNNEKLVNTVTIQADGDGRVVHGTNHTLATYTIGIIKLGQAALMKMLEQPIVEMNEQIVYNVTHINTSKTDYDGYKLLDILPYNNDFRGSSFHGTYTAKLELTFPVYSSGKTKVNIYELTDSAWNATSTVGDSLSLTAPSESDISGSADTATINLASTTTAVYIGGILGAGDQYKMRIILTPTGNRSGDVYSNNATAITAAGGEEVILAPQVAAVVVYRTVSGLAWEDRNGDGVRQSAQEPLLSGVKVTLLKSDGDPAKDALNQTVQPQTTGADGAYSFENLAQGGYYVKFEGTAGFQIGNYTVSPKQAGSNRQLDSDVSKLEPAGSGALVSAKTDNQTLPAKNLVGPYGYHIRNLDAGFVPPPVSVPVTKTWADSSDAYHLRPAVTAFVVKLYKTVDGDGPTEVAEIGSGDWLGTDGNVWTYTFTGLPKYEGGKLITYTVKEESVPGYALTQDGFNLTNTYTPPGTTITTPTPTPSTPTPTPTETPTPTPAETPTPTPTETPPPPLTPTPPPPPTTTPTPPPPGVTPDPVIVVDDDGVPQGQWTWDDDAGEWIFDPYIPLGDLPATGDSGAALWIALAVAAVFGAAVVLTRKRKV